MTDITKNYFFKMQCEDNPNVIFGGEIDESIDEFKRDIASLGDLILSDLLLGGDRVAFVSHIHSKL